LRPSGRAETDGKSDGKTDRRLRHQYIGPGVQDIGSDQQKSGQGQFSVLFLVRNAVRCRLVMLQTDLKSKDVIRPSD
jgi:hypothetical protein